MLIKSYISQSIIKQKIHSTNVKVITVMPGYVRTKILESSDNIAVGFLWKLKNKYQIIFLCI